MTLNIHRARIAGPIARAEANRSGETIPLGPCFVEETDEDSVVIFCGASGERTAVLTPQEAAVAAD